MKTIDKLVDPKLETKKDNINDFKKYEIDEINRLLNVIETKAYYNKSSIVADKINNLKISDKGNNFDLNTLKDVVFVDEKSTKNLKMSSKKEISIIDKKEVKKLETKLKTEKLRKKTEERIISKTNNFIFERKEEIKKLEKELEDLNKSLEKNIRLDIVNDAENKYKKLNEKISLMKKQYFMIDENTNFVEFDLLNDELLYELISNYKYNFDDNMLIKALAHECKHNLNVMSKVLDLYDKNVKLNIGIEDNKYKSKKKEEKLKSNEELLEKIEKQNDELNNVKLLEERKLNNLKENLEVYSSNNGTYQKIIDNILYLSMLTAGVANSDITLILGSVLMSKGLNKIRKKEVKKYVPYHEIKNIYNESLYQKRQLYQTVDVLSSTLDEVSELKSEFISEFSDFKDQIPEYEEIITKINYIENELNKKITELNEIKKENNEVYELSKKYYKKWVA